MNYAGINCTVILLDLMSEGMGSNWGRVVLCGLVTGIVWYMLSESILIEFYTHENPRQKLAVCRVTGTRGIFPRGTVPAGLETPSGRQLRRSRHPTSDSYPSTKRAHQYRRDRRSSNSR